MKFRHALTGAIYEAIDDGRVRVVEEDGREGIFRSDGRWLRGEVRHADPHLTQWVAGPQLPERDHPFAPTAPRKVISSAVPRSEAVAGTPKERRRGMDLGLAGSKVLVTAASRGIGLSIAQHFADEGCGVAICARSEGSLESARKDLEARGVKVFARTVDVADKEALKGFVDAAAEALGGLDVFISNASGGPGMGESAWRAGFDIDVLSAARGVEAATPYLRESEAGSVVFIGSTAALEFLGTPQPYNAVKAALIAHGSDLAQALAPQGIRVNTVSPGPIYFEGGNWEMIKNAMPQVYEGALKSCAIGRMGTPEEVARAVLFLASPAASLITGANLVVRRRLHEARRVLAPTSGGGPSPSASPYPGDRHGRGTVRARRSQGRSPFPGHHVPAAAGHRHAERAGRAALAVRAASCRVVRVPDRALHLAGLSRPRGRTGLEEASGSSRAARRSWSEPGDHRRLRDRQTSRS